MIYRARNVDMYVRARELKLNIAVSFDQIVEKCETIGELQKLNEEVEKIKNDRR